MKRTAFDLSLFLLFVAAFYMVFMEGFAAPSLSPAGDLIFRVLSASSIQLFFCRRKWPAALKLLPLILTGGFALWGCLLYLGDSVSWQNATFFDLLADYLSPAISCGMTAVLHRFSRNTER